MSAKSTAKSLLAELAQSPIVKLGKPATERQILRAEQELGLKLPPIYRELLKLAGQINIWEQAMFGLGPSAEHWDGYLGMTVTELTLTARREGNVRLPEYLVAIWHDSHQDYQCLDTRKISRGDCPIVLFDPATAVQPRRRPKRIAKGLAEWLRITTARVTAQKADWDAYLAEKALTRRKRSKPKAKRAKKAR